MVVDTSALIAILLAEAGYEGLEAALVTVERAVMPATALLEASMVADGRTDRPGGVAQLDELIADMDIDCIAIGRELTMVARDAFVRYGKGIHPAGLNFGDCFSYALATTRDEPLLFTGADFAQTDVKVAAPPADWKPPAGEAN